MNFLDCKVAFFSFKNVWFTTVPAMLYLYIHFYYNFFLTTTLCLVLLHTLPHLITWLGEWYFALFTQFVSVPPLHRGILPISIY